MSQAIPDIKPDECVPVHMDTCLTLDVKRYILTELGYPNVEVELCDEQMENAIRDTGRVPNLVLSGHVHDYQRIEQTIAPGGPTPFIVCGNGGYHNLHQVHSSPGDKAADTGALLKYAAVEWGFMTLSIDEKQISGTTVEIDRAGHPPKNGDSFSYPAKPIRLANPKSVPTL